MNTEEQTLPNFRIDDSYVYLSTQAASKIPTRNTEMINVVQKLNALDRNKIILHNAKGLRQKAIKQSWMHRIIEQTIYLHYKELFRKPWTKTFYEEHNKLYNEIFNEELNAKIILKSYEQQNGQLLIR